MLLLLLLLLLFIFFTITVSNKRLLQSLLFQSCSWDKKSHFGFGGFNADILRHFQTTSVWFSKVMWESGKDGWLKLKMLGTKQGKGKIDLF